MSSSPIVERIVVGSTAQIHGTHFAAANPRACVIIQGAAGVSQERYVRLSQYLAGEGISAVTYDYSGMCRSRTLPVRKERRTPSQWGREDQTAVLAWAKKRYGSLRLGLVGHSVGGQILGFSPSVRDVHRLVLVAAQCPHVSNWRNPVNRIALRAMWSVLFPVSRNVFGYVPRRFHRGDDDACSASMAEAEHWATNPRRRLLDEPGVRENLAAIRAPVRAYSFTDDAVYAPREAVDVLVAGFTNAPVERLHVAPREVGMERIGHFGYFSKKATALWKDLAEYLTAA
jgi:predicted alpha/beta hydrolase